jgi:acetylornithine deacetylase
MTNLDVLDLTMELVRFPTVSSQENTALTDYLEPIFAANGFELERIDYHDAKGVLKRTLVAKKGSGEGGIGFFSHSDTVPGGGWTSRDPWTPVVEGDRLIGLGACDMKGPLAASIVAAAPIDGDALSKALIIGVTSDEEIGYQGAKEMLERSDLLRSAKLRYAIVPEPTSLAPVYAHKGGAGVVVTAHGRAAHTSTDAGISANFLIAPFLADMAELAREVKSDTSFHRPEFTPPTPGFNMIINDFGTAGNVFAVKSQAQVGFRPMPGDRSDELLAMIIARAEAHGLEVTSSRSMPGFSTDPASPIVQAVAAATDRAPKSVSYGSEASLYAPHYESVLCGPGDIAQAHTDGEWIEIAQLREAVQVYTSLIETFCR